MAAFCRNVQMVKRLVSETTVNSTRVVYLSVEMRVVALGVVEHCDDMLFEITPVPAPYTTYVRFACRTCKTISMCIYVAYML